MRGSYLALLMTYLVGLSTLWTSEVCGARWLCHSLGGLLSGGWVPAHTLPGWPERVTSYLPFARQLPDLYLPGASGHRGLLVQLGWGSLLCTRLTFRALQRVGLRG